MSLASAIAKAKALQQAALEKVHDASITIDDVPYVCSATRSPIRSELANDGWRKMQTAVVHMRKALLPSYPSHEAKILLDGFEWYVIESGQQDPQSITWKLTIKRVIPDPS